MEKNHRQTELNLLKTARGQLDAVINMINDDRYCIDISNQILAVQALLKKSNLEILKKHMNHCLKEAFEDGKGESKIEELIYILNKFSQ
ncbi:MAG: metal-sensing transcriptional repressor [Eubacteriaceae bacterium]